MTKQNTENTLYGFCLLWLGVLLGVSFIATPAKFLVPELDIVTAIKIGRSTFEIYHYFEICIACGTGLALLILRAGKTVMAYFALIGILLVVQYFIVQPLVEQSSDKLFLGIETESKSNAHLYYIFCDCFKALLLVSFLPAIRFIDAKAKLACR